MSIYSSEKAKKSSQEAKDILDDDDSFDDEPTLDDEAYLRKATARSAAMRMRIHRRPQQILVLIIVLISLFVLALCFLGGYFMFHRSSGSAKPLIELCRMHYHEWKAGTGKKEKDFILEGEFFQQTEIDYGGETYEKLSVPKLLNAKSSVVLHDFVERLTAIISLDDGRCYIMTLNSTLVKPLPEFYQIVKNIKAGYDSPDAEVIRNSYRLTLPAVSDVSPLGSRVYSQCRYRDSYRIERVDAPLAVGKKSTECKFLGEQYSMGSAGTQYMEIITISECVE